MPTPDPNNVLFQIAHPDLYERNPFNVLNLPVDATAKDIRRRKEDIEAAFDAGTEAAEFANILPGDEARKTPTRAEVDELFATLEDPEKRIAYALFWFWPETISNPSSRQSRIRNPNGLFGHSSSIEDWENKVRTMGDVTGSANIPRHNLAIFHHMMALSYELELKKYGTEDVDTPDEIRAYWRSAIANWNFLSEDLDWWHLVSLLAKGLNDPRIGRRFFLSLHDQFAFAFDQINVELAIDFARRGREIDAKRQVEYMKLSQPDSDDVEGALDNAFASLLRQTETVANSAREEAKKNPKTALDQANSILEKTDEPLRVSRIVLRKGSSLRNAVCKAIFTGVRNCLTIYGNETKDWRTGLSATKQIRVLAETPEQSAILDKDEEAYQRLIAKDDSQSACCVCGEYVPTKTRETVGVVPMHKNIRVAADGISLRFDKQTVLVPICKHCKTLFAIPTPATFVNLALFAVHPMVRKAIFDGWRIGSSLSEEEAEHALGIFRRDGVYHEVEKYTDCSREAAKTIFCFHEWCRANDQLFGFIEKELTTIPLKSNRRPLAVKALFGMTEELFSMWNINPTDQKAIYERLLMVRNLDTLSVSGHAPSGIAADGEYFGPAERSADPMAETYRKGYDSVAIPFYTSDLSFDVERAHDDLHHRLVANETTSRYCGFDESYDFMTRISDERTKLLFGIPEGSVLPFKISAPCYGGSIRHFAIKIFAWKKPVLSVKKTQAVFVLDVDLNAMNRFEHPARNLSCVRWTLHQKHLHGQAFASPEMILETVLRQFSSTYGTTCFAGSHLIKYGRTEDVLQALYTLLVNLIVLLVQELSANGYNVEENPDFTVKWDVTDPDWRKITQ